MRKSRWLLIGVAILVLLFAGIEWYQFYTPADPVSAPPVAEAITAQEVHTMGNPKAKVTLIEYAALTCPTCAFVAMHVIPEFKRRYVDTGKVLYVYRLFPIDPADGKAEKLARCLPKEQYPALVDMLYRRQDEWGPEQMQEHGPGFDAAHQPRTDAGLLRMARFANLDPEKARSCMTSTALDAAINDVAAEGARRYGVSGTPTIVINGQLFGSVPQSVDDLARVIDPILEGK
jgi:protein-disulfide isomerase